MLGRDDDAQTWFECALARQPDYLPAAAWLGDLHYRAGRLYEAISTYEAARQRSPGARALQAPLAAWREEQDLLRRFRSVRTEHFTALFEAATDEPLAREILDRLEASYQRIGATLGTYPRQPLTVVLSTREQYRNITKLDAWSVAAYDGRIRVPISVTLQEGDELDRLLSHEYVHAVVAHTGGRTVPNWLNEGLASVLEPGGSADLEGTLLRAGVKPELPSLHGSFVGLSRRDARIAYASAARAARRLLDLRGAAAVVALLEDLAGGVPFDSAFQQRMAMRYEDFATLVARN